MTVVYEPPDRHSCPTGTWPASRAGTVRQCNCGRTWVAYNELDLPIDSILWMRGKPKTHTAWRVETRGEQRRRERAQRRAKQESVPASTVLPDPPPLHPRCRCSLPPASDTVDWARMEAIPKADLATLSACFKLTRLELLGMQTTTVKDLLALAERRKWRRD